MANRPSHATQQKLLAFLAGKPGRSVHKTGPEILTKWIAKRLNLPENTVIFELENLERQGDIKLQRVKTSGSGTVISTAAILNHVEPEDWAVAQNPDDEEEETVAALPENLDYRKLADGLLIAAFEAISGEREQPLREEVEALQAKLSQTETTLSLARAERDEAIRKRRGLEDELKEMTGQLREAQQKVTEFRSEYERMAEKVAGLQRQLRDLTATHSMFQGLSPQERVRVGGKLSELIAENR